MLTLLLYDNYYKHIVPTFKHGFHFGRMQSHTVVKNAPILTFMPIR